MIHCAEIKSAAVCNAFAVVFLTDGDIRNITAKIRTIVLIFEATLQLQSQQEIRMICRMLPCDLPPQM